MDQSNEPPKSFLQILKEDPSRKNELLAAAASISAGDELELTGDDEIDDEEVDTARQKAEITLDQQKWPVVVIPVTKMKKFIRNKTTGDGDLLIFYLATYKTQKQVDRYNRRNGTNFSLAELRGRPTLLLQSLSNFNSFLLKQKLADIGRLCPPPRGECY